MANNNPSGGARYWFDGVVSSSIDNGINSVDSPWIGTSKYWVNGLPQGYLQGGPGSVGDSPPNIFLDAIPPPVIPDKGSSYSTIL